MRIDVVRLMLALLLLAMRVTAAQASTYIVAPSGGDFTTIQGALDVAVAGDTILVQDNAATYREKLTFPRSGSAGAGSITLRAYPGHRPILDGTGVTGANMMLLENRSYVRILGFEIRNNLGVNDGSAIRISGAGSFLEVCDNVIHDMRGVGAMAITIYGTSTSASISDLIIDGNVIYDCEPADSEALTLNGNVERFVVSNNVVHDVNNIGIDFIGGEVDVNPSFVARNGVCAGNRVTRAHASYGGGFAAGIYVDGGKDIMVRGNVVTQSDMGIEIGAENAGITVTGVTVRDNLLHANTQAGLVFGGFDSTAGRVRSCEFVGNTCYKNDTTGQFLGELWINWASDNAVRDNIFYCTAQNVLLYSENGNVNNALDFNTWYTEAGSSNAEFVWRNTSYVGFAAYRAGTGQDAHSQFANPQFVDPMSGDFALQATSPAIDAGNPADRLTGMDLAHNPRCLDGRLAGVMIIDCGAYERDHAHLAVNGVPTSGGVLTFDVTGTRGLASYLWVATLPGDTTLRPFGALFFSFGAPWIMLPWGTIPSSVAVTLPPGLPPGLTIVTQVLGLALPAGNTSNAVTVAIE